MKTTQKAIGAMKEKGYKFSPAKLQLSIQREGGGTESTGTHRVTILRDEQRKDVRVYEGKTNYKEVQGIRYWFDEDGAEKYYDVPLLNKKGEPHYLLAKFEEIEEGDELELEYVKKGIKEGYIDVRKVGVDTAKQNASNQDGVKGTGGEDDIPQKDSSFDEFPE